MKIKTAKTMTKHILSWYNKANPQELIDGLLWYHKARAIAVDALDYNATNAELWNLSQVIAIMSPQVSWQQNIINAKDVYKCYRRNTDVLGLKCFATELQKVNAYNCLNNDYSIPNTALKTYSFAKNINDPFNDSFVTIDRHATKVALNDLKAGGVHLTKNNYITIADCYKKVAKKLCIRPCELQAITWITYKRIVNR